MTILDILAFDQQATLEINSHHSLFWNNIMMTVTNTFSWSLIILILFYVIFKNNTIKESFVILITIGLLIATMDRVCSGIVKPWIERRRPTQDPYIMYFVNVVENYRGGRFGFFSGHASNTFCVSTFLAFLFRSRSLTATLFFWCVTTTFTRIYLGVHYLGDILVGAFMGFLFGFLFYLAYKRLRSCFGHAKLISEQFTSTGYLQTDISFLLLSVFLNYILIIIFSLIRGIL